MKGHPRDDVPKGASMRAVDALVKSLEGATEAQVTESLGSPDEIFSAAEANLASEQIEALGSMLIPTPARCDFAWGFHDPYRHRTHVLGFAKGGFLGLGRRRVVTISIKKRAPPVP